MATATGITVDTDANRVVLEGITVEDEDLVEYIEEFDSDRREEAVERAIRVGASALQIVGTSKDLQFVEQRFDEMERELENEIDDLRDELDQRFGDDGEVSRILNRHLGDDGRLQRYLEEAFGDDGHLVERLDEELGEDGEKIQEALDPDRDGTPTFRLEKRLREEIELIKERLSQEEGREEIRQESRHKGFDFEDRLEDTLSRLVHQTPNQIEDTSEKEGSIDNSKKGDFVITLDETGQRIVVEAKNGNFNNTVEDEMEEAIENREAEYGILVARSLEYLPRTKVGWFSEFDQDYVVVALSEDSDEDVEPRFLKFAYHWARTRTLLSFVEVGDDVDAEAIKTQLDGIKSSIDRFKEIRKECTNLEGSVSDIRSTLTEVEDEITSRIARLEAELGGAVD